MLNNTQTFDCPRADDIVAYIYDEIDSSERSSFEKHLPECISCTDEFALVSDARFSVFEWNKEEFVPLATPKFSIPYSADREKTAGLIPAFIEAIRNLGWPVTAGALLVLSVAVLLGMLAIIASESEVARVAVEPIPITSENPQTNGGLPDLASDDSVEKPETADAVVVPEIRNDRPTPTHYRNAMPKRRSSPLTRSVPGVINSKAPMLSTYEDTEDKTLRLSDLLNEVGG